MGVFSNIKIVSGGQTGVDRAALDFAIKNSIDYGGWCPEGGWAEDATEKPGIIKNYPNMKETLLKIPEQRTEWNARDSDATLIIYDSAAGLNSNGTAFTKEMTDKFKKPVMMVDLESESASIVLNWLKKTKEIKTLNVAGPRESESPGIYEKTLKFLDNI